jgi:DNA polymerase III alpha subunit
MRGPRYAELQVTSHFSFLRGASSCEELFAAAAIMRIGACHTTYNLKNLKPAISITYR